jgi:hypothetical protein
MTGIAHHEHGGFDGTTGAEGRDDRERIRSVGSVAALSTNGEPGWALRGQHQ